MRSDEPNPCFLYVAQSASVYFMVELMSSSRLYAAKKKLIPNARLTPATRLARAVQLAGALKAALL